VCSAATEEIWQNKEVMCVVWWVFVDQGPDYVDGRA